MEKIRYRLVYNRKKCLNRQGTALVQVEATLGKRKVYFTTNLYLRTEHWNGACAQVDNHPQADDLNVMLYEFILHLQEIELGFWKRGIPATLSLLKEAVRKETPVEITFIAFARQCIADSDKRESTKSNLLTTVNLLCDFRPVVEFKDLTYTFLRDFESFLRQRGNSVNTIGKHMRQLRTLVNEAINQEYMHSDAYPFRKYRIRQEKKRHEFLTPSELKRMEALNPDNKKQRHLLDAFLFCCYTGLRFSDFCQLRNTNLVKEHGRLWLQFKSVKTGIELRLPLYLLFGGKSLCVLSHYRDLSSFAHIPRNSEVNRELSKLTGMAGIRKHVTFHTARHTCATLLIHQGVAITTVQKLLGHTSVRTTEIYSEILSNTVVRELKHTQRKGRVK